MQCRILRDEDRPLFERALTTFTLGDYAQSWEWGDLKRRTGWEPLRLGVFDTRSVRLVASVLVRKVPVPLADWTLLYCPRGPASDPEDWDAFHAFLQGVRALGRELRAILLKIDPDLEDSSEARWMLRSLGMRRGRRRGAFEGFLPRHVARLDIVLNPMETFSAFHPKGRYNVRLAYRRGVRVVEGGPGDLPAFYRLLEETARRQRFFLRDYAHIKDLYDTFVAGGKGCLLLAFRQGTLLAGALIVLSGRKASYLLGASSTAGREHMPAYLVQWEAIHWAQEKGARMYDFLGIGDPARRGALDGLWAFKSKFGSRPVSFVGEWDLPLDPAAYALWAAFESPLSKARATAARLRVRRRPKPALGEVEG